MTFMWSLMTSEVILYLISGPHNVSIHRNFYQNRFINEYARKKKAKISESLSHRFFLVRYRRTCVLNKTIKTQFSLSHKVKLVYSMSILNRYWRRKADDFKVVYIELFKSLTCSKDFRWKHTILM